MIFIFQVKNGRIYNFEPLHRKNDHWKIDTGNDTEIQLNVFGPLLFPNEENNCLSEFMQKYRFLI